MGRPELPVDPAAGPVQRLAHDLRELRSSAGGVLYRTMAKKAGFSVTTLAKAASGERLPSLAVVQAYVQACGADPAAWESRWAEAEAPTHEEKQEDADAAPPYRGLARFEVRLSPDGRTLATAERIGDRYLFQLRNPRDSRLLRTLPPPSRPAFSTGIPAVPGEAIEPLLSFSPDGGMFAYGLSIPPSGTPRLSV